MMTHKTAPVNCHNHYTDGKNKDVCPLFISLRLFFLVLSINNNCHEGVKSPAFFSARSKYGQTTSSPHFSSGIVERAKCERA